MHMPKILTNKKMILIVSVLITFTLTKCTKLHEELNSELTEEQAQAYLKKNADFNALLEKVYRDFDPFLHYDGNWAMQEVTTDEAIVPTRPNGWDDDGKWRRLYTHTWTPDDPLISSVFTYLNLGVFDATNILSFGPTEEVAAEARFLRAYYMYNLLDLYGKFPFRDPGTDLLLLPKVYEGKDGIDFLISEVEAVIEKLPDGAPDHKANKNAAHALLAKMYLNRGVYEHPASPTFADSDMDKVIANVNSIKNKSLNFFWNNYQPNNGSISSELIFTVKVGQYTPAYVWLWHATMYLDGVLPTGTGWSGFATTPGFYSTLEDGDIRKKYNDPVVMAKGGYNVGFIDGQQYFPGGTVERPDVIITPEIPTLVGASPLAGVRVIKYVPDFSNPWAPGNDWILICYSDALLMKAEALFRKDPSSAEALAIINEIRENRSATPGSLPALAQLTADDLLSERGRDLYWQGGRRIDLRRFGKFLDARPLKGQSDPKYLVFPIPRSATLDNPNLTQNPGY